MLQRIVCVIALLLMIPDAAMSEETISGTYVEARTCQIYTGPCFANGEVGSAGKDAVMGWQIKQGKHEDVDLAGLAVAMVVKSSHTLGFQGFENAETIKAVIFVDSDATSEQQSALRRFAMVQTGIAEVNILSVRSDPIDIEFDVGTLNASLKIGSDTKIVARKARAWDCICSNEAAYYPPLTKLTSFVPGVTIEGDVTARALGTRWSIPDTRTAYIGLFELDGSKNRIAAR